MKPKILLIAAAALAAPLAVTAPVMAAGGIFIGTEGGNVAVSGYDTVSYFQGNGTPVRGDARYRVMHDGVEYRFSSQANADLFAENPDAYAPQYGGHCAWAMGRGYLAPGDPTAYKVVDGKLYLNFNTEVQQKWLADIPGFISKGDVNWDELPEGKRFGA